MRITDIVIEYVSGTQKISGENINFVLIHITNFQFLLLTNEIKNVIMQRNKGT